MNFSNKNCWAIEKNANLNQISPLFEIIQKEISIKTLENKMLNGPLILKFAYEIVEYLKKGTVINLNEVVEQIFSSEAKEILEDVKREFLMKVFYYFLSKKKGEIL